MKANEASKAVTARFSMQDYLKIQEEAEQRGCTIADVIRNSWSEHQQQHQVKQQLLRLEQRQRKTIFEMLCVVVGLQPAERKAAIHRLKDLGMKW